MVGAELSGRSWSLVDPNQGLEGGSVVTTEVLCLHQWELSVYNVTERSVHSPGLRQVPRCGAVLDAGFLIWVFSLIFKNNPKILNRREEAKEMLKRASTLPLSSWTVLVTYGLKVKLSKRQYYCPKCLLNC